MAVAPLSRVSSPCNLDDPLAFDFTIAPPHTLSRRWVGLSLKAALEEVGRAVVARCDRRLAENDRDELATVTSGARHDIEAGFANEAGLHAVRARKADEEAVMSADDLLAHLHLDR